MHLPILRVHFKKEKKGSAKDSLNDAYAMFLCEVSDFLCKGICCGYSFELHRQVDAIQIGTTT